MGRLDRGFDKGLATTREMLLRGHGFEVTPVLSLQATVEAAKQCHYDLAILGHTIPLSDKRQIAQAVKDCDGHVKLLGLLRPATAPIPDVDFSLEASEGPEALLDKVHEIFEKQY